MYQNEMIPKQELKLSNEEIISISTYLEQNKGIENYCIR